MFSEEQMAEGDRHERTDVSLAIYDMTVHRAPSLAVRFLRYGLLSCALLGLAGSLVMYASQKCKTMSVCFGARTGQRDQ